MRDGNCGLTYCLYFEMLSILIDGKYFGPLHTACTPLNRYLLYERCLCGLHFMDTSRRTVVAAVLSHHG